MEQSYQQQTKRDVIKHSAAIQIQNNVTLLQRRAWNVLLANAYDELPIQDIHQISVQRLMMSLEFNSKNEDYLKEAIEALVGCRVKWNILDKDGSVIWGVAALLASAELQHGICTYGFAPHMRQRLHNPRMYARLCLSLQNKFDSKHALALWELCTDYLGSERDYGETPFIPLEQFRELMGAGGEKYSAFRDLNKYVIKEPIAEINSVSDFRVTVDYQRQGRKVVGLKFKIRRVQQLLIAGSNQPDLFPDLQDLPAVVKILKEAGIAVNDAWEIWQQGFDYVERGRRPNTAANGDESFLHYVREKVHLLNQRKKGGKLITNPSGFLLTALKKNYANALLEQEQANAARSRQEEDKRNLESQRERLIKEQDSALAAVSEQMIAAIPDLVEQAVADIRQQKDAGFNFSYEREKTALENYQAHRYIALTVSHWLEARFPERFAEVRKQFDAKLEAIDRSLRGLGNPFTHRLHLQVRPPKQAF